ncbi:MAG: ribosome silencing factor RsfS [Cycloclasticus sp. symbiont of Poecilosclerida sp. M]|nr:MAG: ribosome silencing factor RsfS [Cycloclasticus sp. symbiont of Poecilosclerida sp. M]
MSKKLIAMVIDALEEKKAKEIEVFDVADKCSFTDYMVVASGNSNRQVKSLANEVVMKSKAAGLPPIGVEGMDVGEWVLVDLGDVIVHVMQPQTRSFYQLEKLWSVEVSEAEAS